MLDWIDPRALMDDLLEVTVVGSFSRIGPAFAAGCSAGCPAAPTLSPVAPCSSPDRRPGLGRRVGRRAGGRRSTRRARGPRPGAPGEPCGTRSSRATASIASRWSSPTWDRWRPCGPPPSRCSPPSRAWTSSSTTPGAIFPERTVGPDGIEASFATMVVGPFALIGGLLPLLRRTPGARVIAVTSGGQYAQASTSTTSQSSEGALRRHPHLRPGQARPGLADPRVGSPHSAGRDPLRIRCIRAGRARPGCPTPCPASPG